MKIQNAIASLILLVFVSLTTSCELKVAPGAIETTTDSGEKGGADKIIIIKDVVRIFMHQPNQYTYWYRASGVKNYVSTFTVTSDIPPDKIFTDAKKGKSWVKYWGFGNSTCLQQEIHVNSLDEVNGAGWEKTTDDTIVKGSTSVIN